MASEGISRASASEVAARAWADHGLEMSPSKTGQTFSSLGLRTVASRGRNRLVLDPEELGHLRDRLELRMDEIEPQVLGALASFDELSERTKLMETQLTDAKVQADRYTEVSRELNGYRSASRNLELVETQLRDTRAQADRVEAIRVQIGQLEEFISTQGVLLDRHRVLVAKVRENQAWEVEIKRGEGQMAEQRSRLKRQIEEQGVKRQDLHRRFRQLAVVDVEQVLRKRRNELDELLVQLGEKRSLLSRLFGKKVVTP